MSTFICWVRWAWNWGEKFADLGPRRPVVYLGFGDLVLRHLVVSRATLLTCLTW